jgi:hypothetical protein
MLLFAPTISPVLQPKIQIARETQSVMATDCPPAIRAIPFFFLALKERIHSLLADLIQIPDHAHVILVTITFIQLFQAPARIIPALGAEANQAEPDLLAAVGHMRTMLSARDATGAVRPMKTLLAYIVLLTQICNA